MELDRLRESLNEEGFDFETPAEMLEAVVESLGGQRVWPTADRGVMEKPTGQLVELTDQSHTPIVSFLEKLQRRISEVKGDFEESSGVSFPSNKINAKPKEGVKESHFYYAQATVGGEEAIVRFVNHVKKMDERGELPAAEIVHSYDVRTRKGKGTQGGSIQEQKPLRRLTSRNTLADFEREVKEMWPGDFEKSGGAWGVSFSIKPVEVKESHFYHAEARVGEEEAIVRFVNHLKDAKSGEVVHSYDVKTRKRKGTQVLSEPVPARPSASKEIMADFEVEVKEMWPGDFEPVAS